MSGWVPMPAEVWPLVRPTPNPGGSRTGSDGSTPCGPWTDEVAGFDLRWEYDQTGRISSRGALAKRWGWTRDEVRTLLRHPERWWDPMKGPLPTSRDDLTQRDPSRPKLTQTDPRRTDETEESSPRDPARPSLTQPDPVVPQRGDPPSPPPSPPQAAEEESAPPATLALTSAPGPKKQRKPKASKPPDPAAIWAQQWTEVWNTAWRAARPTAYPWDFFRERALLVRAAGAVGAEPEQPVPSDAHARLTKAIGAYLDAAARGAAWPSGPATVQGFVAGLSGWVQQADGCATTKTGKNAHDWTPPPATGPPVDEAEVDRTLEALQQRAREAAAEREANLRRAVESKQPPRRQVIPR